MDTIKKYIVKTVLIICIINTNSFTMPNNPRTPQQNALLLACTILQYEHNDKQIQEGYSLFLQQLQSTIYSKKPQITRSAVRRLVEKAQSEAMFDSQDAKKRLRKDFMKKISFFPSCPAQDFENAYDYITEHSTYPKKQTTDFYYQKTLEIMERQEEQELTLPAIQPAPSPSHSRQSSSKQKQVITPTVTKFPKISD